ncbi:hypothetical protein LCGC14_0475520 [marine sediment metagenome]|uniref:Uncharacterized protein n=1 Tax=marine sediment metagenome TaxID=412755 RepID=A0A0F9SG89_9ZZZZ
MEMDKDEDENQVPHCPSCGAPLGVNGDMEIQPCQGCADGNIPE